MAKVLTDSRFYFEIADAIRGKNGSINTYSPSEMATAINLLATGSSISDGITITDRNANGYPVAAELYCSDGIIHSYTFGNAQGATTSTAWRYLESLRLKSRITRIDTGAFQNCMSLTSITSEIDENPFEYVESFDNNIQWCNTFSGCGISGNLSFPNYHATQGQCQQFYGAVNITGLSCPNVRGVHQYFATNCTSLKNVFLPKCSIVLGNQRYPFGGCTALETVELGSIGFPCTVSRDGSGDPFHGCTQANLTVICFCNASSVDSTLANIRNGATNATIIIKACEDITYGGTFYAAGETVITSTV